MTTTSKFQSTPLSPGTGATQPGRLFNAEDFALAELEPSAVWDRIISLSVREQASDVHFSYQSDGAHVAVRLDGRLAPQGTLPSELGQRVTNHVKVLANLDVGERRRPQDGHIGLEIDGRPIDLRASLLPTIHGEDTAVRILDRDVALISLEQLGACDTQLGDLASLIRSPSGLILVTGATGAGKTTTMYAMLRSIADGSRRIVTIENPVEFDLPHISQAPVNYKLGLDYATLLRSVLRQDPNVIMIGEIRDRETAETVVRAANSGRLVVTTSHAAYSGSAIEALLALNANTHLVARALRGVVAQTLARRLCPYCTIRLEETADIRLLEDVSHLLQPQEKPVLSMGRGCPHCRHTGYRGRIGVFEIMVADDTVRDLLTRGTPARQVYDYARQHGLITIAQAGKLAALRGQTTIEELLQNVSEIWTDDNA